MRPAAVFAFVFSPFFGSIGAGVVLLLLNVIGRKFFLVLAAIGVVISLINSIIAVVLLSRH